MKAIKHFPLTMLSALMLGASAGLYLMLPDFRTFAIYLLAFSNVMVFLAGVVEAKKKVLWMYGLTYLSAIITGILLDHYYESFLLITVALVSWNSVFMLRQIFFYRWGMIHYRWVELLSWVIGTLGAILALSLSRKVNSLSSFNPLILFSIFYFLVALVSYFQYFWLIWFKNQFEISPLKIGDPAPRFQLPDENGQIVDLYADYINKGKSVLLFFNQGGWSPCTYVMLHSFEKHYQLFHENGIEVLSINSDSAASNKFTKEMLNLHYKLLYDPDLELAKTYGFLLPKVNPMVKTITKSDKGISSPAVVLINNKGEIVYISNPKEMDCINPSRIYQIIEKEFVTSQPSKIAL
jgi:peroxiredoxin Q/BCP